jgi:hypothetical protein
MPLAAEVLNELKDGRSGPVKIAGGKHAVNGR